MVGKGPPTNTHTPFPPSSLYRGEAASAVKRSLLDPPYGPDRELAKVRGHAHLPIQLPFPYPDSNFFLSHTLTLSFSPWIGDVVQGRPGGLG